MRQLKIVVLFALILITPRIATAQNELKLGAYYFDGWTGKTFHATVKLKQQFPERQPIWGWKTSTPEIIDKQIIAAHEAGLDFFSFCWYYNPNTAGKYVAKDPKNNALNLYRKSPQKSKLGFTILVVNNGSYAIREDEWGALNTYWIKLFKDSSYLMVNQRPLLTFFDVESLVKSFGTTAKVKGALDSLRNVAIREGFKGVSFAANVGAEENLVKLAGECGFDILTGYNYHKSGLLSSKSEVIKIDNMRTTEEQVWNKVAISSGKPIIPVVTLNWDRRPWDKDYTASSPRFAGYSSQSVTNAITSCKTWMAANKGKLVPEKVAVLYAWNEYGEGAWLTPSKKLKNSLLEAVKAGLK